MSYCNYRQNWIKDDAEKPNLPLLNCMPLNFKKTPIIEGSTLSPDTHESTLVLDGINFGNIAITFAELATIDTARLSKVTGINKEHVRALSNKKQTASLEVDEKSQNNIRPDDLIGRPMRINYNYDYPANSHSLWMQEGEEWNKLNQVNYTPKNDAPVRRKSLSNIFHFRFDTEDKLAPAANTNNSQLNSSDLEYSVAPSTSEHPSDISYNGSEPPTPIAGGVSPSSRFLPLPSPSSSSLFLESPGRRSVYISPRVKSSHKPNLEKIDEGVESKISSDDEDGRDLDRETEQTFASTNDIAEVPGSSVQKAPDNVKVQHSKLKPQSQERFEEY